MSKVYFINGLPTVKNLGLYHHCVKSYDQNKVCLECPIRGLPRVKGVVDKILEAVANFHGHF